MTTFDIIFYIFAILTVASAGIVVFSRNIMYSAFSLLFTFSGVAGIYILLNADFIAITQLLIYVGGILILIIFGVMLTTDVTNIEVKARPLKTMPGTVVVAVISALLVSMMITTKWKAGEPGNYETTVANIGELLLSRFLLPFEIASILLLVALMGAAFLARRR